MKWDSHVLGSFWNFSSQLQQQQYQLQRCHHCAVIVDKIMYIFGGLIKDSSDNTSEIPTNSFLKYSIDSGEYISSTASRVPPLSHHTMNFVEFSNGKRYLYVFGGRLQDGTASNHTYRYDIAADSWTIILASNQSKMPARFGHSANVIDGGDKIVVFGGTDGQGQYFQDLYIFDIAAMTWQRAKTQGAVPSARSGHSCVLFGTRLFLFGGGNDNNLFNDLYSLDLDSLTWKPIQTKGVVLPIKRMYHTASVIGNKMVVFGGVGKTYTNEVITLDLEHKVWETEETNQKPTKKKSAKQAPAVQAPFLHAHSAVQSGTKIWIFGGKCTDKFSTGYLYTLETDIRGVQPIDVGRCSLASDLLSIVDESSSSDVVLELGETDFHCHKAILRTRCALLHKECVRSAVNDSVHITDVLNKLIEKSQMIFSTQDNLLSRLRESSGAQASPMSKQLIDISVDAFKTFLEYVYTDQIPDVEVMSEQEMVQLCILAQLFSLKRLYFLTYSTLLSVLNQQSQQLLSIPPPTLYEDMKRLYSLTRKASRMLNKTRVVTIETEVLGNIQDEPKPKKNKTKKPKAKNNKRKKTYDSEESSASVSSEDDEHVHETDEDEQSGESFEILSESDFDDSQSDFSEDISITHSDVEDMMSSVSSSTLLSLQINANPLAYSYCDIVFSVDSEKFCAHKSIIVARSDYLHGLLVTELQQQKQKQADAKKEIVITGVRPKIFKRVLEYLYTGCCPIKFDYALELMVVAESYDLERLSLMCQQVIERKLHVHNVSRILDVAEAYDIQHLRDSCTYFIIHHYSQVRKTSGYKELQRHLKIEMKELRKQLRGSESSREGSSDYYSPFKGTSNKYQRKFKKPKTTTKRTPSMPTLEVPAANDDLLSESPTRQKSKSVAVPKPKNTTPVQIPPASKKRSQSQVQALFKSKSFSADTTDYLNDENAYLSSSPELTAHSPTFNVDYFKQSQESAQVSRTPNKKKGKQTTNNVIPQTYVV